jgi:hypothetical protein
MLLKELLKKFKEIYLKEFGVDISDELVISISTELLTLYRAVLGDFNSTDNNRKDE